MSQLSQITCATMEIANGIIDNLYKCNDEKAVLNYDDFKAINLTRSKYYEIQEDGLLIKLADEPFKVSSKQFEYIMNCYIDKGFRTAEEMGIRENSGDFRNSKAYATLTGYAEHSLIHIFETMRQSHLSCQRIQRSDLEELKPEIEKIATKTCLLHDLGMSNGLQLSGVTQGLADTAKEYRSAHSGLSGYTILSDMKSMFTDEKEMYLCALAAASHSKSNSGLRAFDENTISAFLDKFEERCNNWDEIRGITDPTFNRETAEKILQDNMLLFQESSRVVSLADSCSHSRYTMDTLYSQTRGTFEIFKTEESSLGEDITAFSTIGPDMKQKDPIIVLEGEQPLEHLKTLVPNLDKNGITENESFYVLYTDEFGDKELIKPNEFIIGEHFCSFQEQYYNDEGSMFQLRIGNINPDIQLAENGVSNYIYERVGEMWRYYTDKDMEFKVDIICDHSSDTEQKWLDIVQTAVFRLDDPNDRGDIRNHDIKFYLNGNEVERSY